MPMPVRALPVVQNWDCRNCGDCCRSYAVRVSEVEKARIDAQGWDVPGVVPDGKGGHQLAHTPTGACVFLGPDERCQIHAKFGAAAKPMACRVYPFVLVPAGDHWRVGMRMSCPSAAANLGRSLKVHAAELAEFTGLIEADAGTHFASNLPAPDLQPGQPATWPDLLRFTKCLTGIMADAATPVDHRLRKILALAELCKKSRFETVTGGRLAEFLTVITGAVAEDVPVAAADVPPPKWLGRTVFRQMAAIYSRTDNGRNAGVASRGRWTRIRAAWRFAVGKGTVPKLHARIPATTFAAAEQPDGPMTPAMDALLTRFYLVKLESMQFAGPTNYRRSYWAGLDSLALTYPVIQWLARVLAAAGSLTREDALALAVRQVDDHYGYNPQLGTARMAWGTQVLADRGEIGRLAAWYSR